ncbi:hypothetical protein PFLUV_G00046920 [Perca fluviatilis]|uniref:Uncharacterized protein n=1 Tax=Perca fluviatilis TaxID=8168 RepID=A0A6A5F9Q5_PERFL|nr:hypothetical protein PFLUV_G00046920 [Perca fluviatilis]
MGNVTSFGLQLHYIISVDSLKDSSHGLATYGQQNVSRAPDWRTDHAAALSQRERKERPQRTAEVVAGLLVCPSPLSGWLAAASSVHLIAPHPEG